MSALVDRPACGPSTTSTLAPARGLNAVSYTVPLINRPLGDGIGAVGLAPVVTGTTDSWLPHAAVPSIRTRTAMNRLIESMPDELDIESSVAVNREDARLILITFLAKPYVKQYRWI